MCSGVRCSSAPGLRVPCHQRRLKRRWRAAAALLGRPPRPRSTSAMRNWPTPGCPAGQRVLPTSLPCTGDSQTAFRFLLKESSTQIMQKKANGRLQSKWPGLELLKRGNCGYFWHQACMRRHPTFTVISALHCSETAAEGTSVEWTCIPNSATLALPSAPANIYC